MDSRFIKLIVHSFSKHNFQIKKDTIVSFLIWNIRSIIQGLIKLLEDQGSREIGGLNIVALF
jgi:hypothetical protein